MKTSCIIIMIIFSSIRSDAQTWNLVWSDEFNDASINTTNWKYDIGGGGWGNSELEYYTNRPENAKIDNGNLLIIARKESYGGSNYTSARLKTQDLRYFTYGKIEARIKLPVGQGLWTAFWTLGQNISSVGWPKCGEVDIMEHIDKENMNHGTMHWDNNGHVQYGGGVSCDESIYHNYSIEWNADSIKWLLDGNRYFWGNIANNVNSTDEFHLPFFIILNFAVGGSWPGNPDATTPFPDTMYVDYVRVYQVATNAVEDSRSQVSNHFSLLQNYPNPFNPSTSISYQISSASFVSLKIFDILGREVTTLVNEMKDPGTYEMKWNATQIPSGVYFYKLSAGSYTQTKKLVLSK
ncbi:MAG: family 16 glycosylhydrolase [Ignavibacteriales bacterium]|nr:family 16 glycosylhydrolase [Ignavibacteriales bacterium]